MRAKQNKQLRTALILISAASIPIVLASDNVLNLCGALLGVMSAVTRIALSSNICSLDLSIDPIIDFSSIPFHFAIISFLCATANAVTAMYM